MTIVTLLARFLLAGVFVVSGVGKALDPRSTRSAFREFGIPAVASTPLTFVVPLLELVLAASLILATTAYEGSIGAVVLLCMFSAGIGLNLLNGRTPDCHCFGQIHSAPIGLRTLARNAVLAGLGVLIILEHGGSPLPTWWRSQSVAARIATVEGAVVIVALALGASVLWQLFVRYGALLQRFEQMEASQGRVGAGSTKQMAPAFELGGLYGETISLASLMAKRQPLVLIFSDPNCGPCNALVPDLVRWQRELRSHFYLAVVSRGGVQANLEKFASAGVSDVLVQHDNEVADAYGVRGTPSAVVVTTDGTFDGPPVPGTEGIRSRVMALSGARTVPIQMGGSNGDTAHEGHVHSNGTPQVGDLAPEFELASRDGRNVKLRGLRGTSVALVFWNPECGFCKELEPRLLEWEHQEGDSNQRTIVISSGPTDQINGLNFKSTVLLDQAQRVGFQFGANGTPMAIRVDAQGRIASELAVGGPAVLDLLSSAAT